MESDRFTQSLSRLEAAIARLEQVARAPAADARLAALEERHRRLREGASDALARLDLLIASTPRATGRDPGGQEGRQES